MNQGIRSPDTDPDLANIGIKKKAIARMRKMKPIM
jgi:hypothetical protein